MKTFSKFNFPVAIMIATLLFVSCEKNDPATEPEAEPEPKPKPEWVGDRPGKIPGLGNTRGEPTGTPFHLPDGIETAGRIMGGYDPANYYQSAGKRDSLPYTEFIRTETVWTRAAGDTVRVDTIAGSGMLHVQIFIPLKNTTSQDISVTFPAGLIMKAVTGACQNGLLLKKTTVDVPARGFCGVLLIMYCGNEDLSQSLTTEEYVFTVVSNSSLIMDLCERVKNKRINMEEYPPGRHGYTDSEQYHDYVFQLQDMVWKLTDRGEPLSKEDIAFIEQMENSH
ncbi:MAG: hypothetical protein LBP50_08530 [Tannerella sp.]|jgi:hypothetical protein|nr:hypothetical protein [Tannerella sp.]